jgi:outer membrane murein-binding lipoprotein Lpp
MLEQNLRDQLVQEHMIQTELLRQEYESLLQQATDEAEAKANRKLDIMAQMYQSEVDVYKLKEREWQEKELKLCGEIEMLQTELQAQQGKQDQKGGDSEEVFSRQLQIIMESSEQHIRELEASTQDAIREIQSEYEVRERDMNGRISELTQQVNELIAHRDQLKQTLAEKCDEITQLNCLLKPLPERSDAVELTTIKDADDELEEVFHDLALGCDDNEQDAPLPLVPQMQDLAASIATSTPAKLTIKPSTGSPLFSPLLTGVGLKSAFKNILPGAGANKKIAGVNGDGAAVIVNKKKKLRARRAIFDDDDEDEAM